MTKTRKIFAIILFTTALTMTAGFFLYRNTDSPLPVQERSMEPVKQQTEESVYEHNTYKVPALPSIKTDSTPNLSNEKLGWYFKPNTKHLLPEVNSKGKALLEQYRSIYYGNTGGKNIYLTFDEGYENGYTSKILDDLKEANVKAAFFITGDYLRKNPELVKRMADEGHIVGNHTDNHPSLPEVSDAAIKKELVNLSTAYEQLTGGKMTYLRPPKGEYSERTLRITREMGYTNVFWSVAMMDWVPDAGTPQQHKDTVLTRLHNGAVVLLHAVNKANADMLPSLIEECRQQGYQFKTLNEI